MFVSDRHQFVWISVAKAMTTTMRQWLPEHFEGELVGGFHNRRIPERAKDYYVWAIVRNPYSRALSAWWHTTQDRTSDRKYLADGRHPEFDEPPTFETFMEWMIARPGKYPITTPQAEWLRVLPLSHVFQMETLGRIGPYNLQIGHLLMQSPVVCAPKKWVLQFDFPHTLQSGDDYPDWQEFVVGPRKTLVQRWAGEDFDAYGYDR